MDGSLVSAVFDDFIILSAGVPLSALKCRRNVDAFLDACRALHVRAAGSCRTVDVLQQREIRSIDACVCELLGRRTTEVSYV